MDIPALTGSISPTGKVTDLGGQSIDSEPDFCVFRPQRIERHFKSGLVEVVESSLRHPGLLVSFKYKGSGGYYVKPVFDFRHLDREYSPKYESAVSNDHSILFTIGTPDENAGFVAVAASKSADFAPILNDKRLIHETSQTIGRPSSSFVNTAGEIYIKGSKSTIAFGWGCTMPEAQEEAAQIIRSRKSIKSVREDWMREVLGHLNFRSDNRKFAKSFAWAQVTMHSLLFESNNQHYVLTALPYSPLPNGFFTPVVAEGLRASVRSMDSSINLLSTLLDYQNLENDSYDFGKLPTQFYEDYCEYRIPNLCGNGGRFL